MGETQVWLPFRAGCASVSGSLVNSPSSKTDAWAEEKKRKQPLSQPFGLQIPILPPTNPLLSYTNLLHPAAEGISSIQRRSKRQADEKWSGKATQVFAFQFERERSGQGWVKILVWTWGLFALMCGEGLWPGFPGGHRILCPRKTHRKSTSKNLSQSPFRLSVYLQWDPLPL